MDKKLLKNAPFDDFKTYICKKCKQSINSVVVLARHLKRCNGRSRHHKRSKCALKARTRSECGDKLNYKIQRNSDRRRSLNDACTKTQGWNFCTVEDVGSVKWFRCEKCSYKVRNVKTLKRHVALEHPAENRVSNHGPRCEQCSHGFSGESALKQHACIDRFRCRSQSGLDMHVVCKHVPERVINPASWFHCKQCPFTCQDQSVIKAHIWHKHPDKNHVLLRYCVETGINWFHCRRCSKKMKFSGDLSRFLRAPDTNVWLQCEQCSTRYKLKSAKAENVTGGGSVRVVTQTKTPKRVGMNV